MTLGCEQTARLAPFLERKSARQRIILYLLSIGYRASDLFTLTEDELNAIKLPDDLVYCRDELFDNAKEDRYFIYPISKALKSSPRQKLIDYLLSVGVSKTELQKTPMADILKFEVPEELVDFRDQLAEVALRKRVFVYPCGKPLAHTDFYRLIRSASKKVLGKKMSQDMFYRYINTGII